MASLPTAVRRRLLERCDYVEVNERTSLQPLPGLTAHAWFPTDSVISVLAPADSQHGLEIAAVGNEGLFGAGQPSDALHFELRGSVQAPGHAWRIPSDSLEELTASSPRLHLLIHDYLRVMLTQTARQAACCRFHSLSQRLARWLLTHADCGATDDVMVTHSGLALLLGAQRARVTVAVGQFERRGLIGSGRGHIVVRDRAGLAAAACSCYAMNRKSYQQGMDCGAP